MDRTDVVACLVSRMEGLRLAGAAIDIRNNHNVSGGTISILNPDGKAVMVATTDAFINCAFTSGLVDLRALLEFLGWTEDRKTGFLCQMSSKSVSKDDWRICDFESLDGVALAPLSDKYLRLVAGDNFQALMGSILRLANKRLVHNSKESVNEIPAADLLAVFRTVYEAMKARFFEASGIELPPSKIVLIKTQTCC